MEELKTLRDFAAFEDHIWGKFGHEEDCIGCERNRVLQELKAEAVKWVKEIRSNPEPYGVNILSGLNKKQREITKERAINLFMDFFNLTEKDLEEKMNKEEKSKEPKQDHILEETKRKELYISRDELNKTGGKNEGNN